MKKTYITHVTRDYLEVALNLAKSINLFSNLPLIVYCIGLEESDKEKFNGFKNIQLRNIEIDISDANYDDYTVNNSGNFYINRASTRIYKILSAKTIAMQMALEEGWQEVCYLDSDCIATPVVDELFDWLPIITDFPIGTEGIHEYMVVIENGKQRGNPFEFTWPIPDNKFSLEWPLMNFMQMEPEQRGRYRTTGIMLMNQNCLPFIKTWKEFCFLLPKLVDTNYYAPFHEETIYNVLSWKKEDKGFPLCYINIGEGLQTVNHFYSDESREGILRWSDTDTSQNFYKIPDNKKYVKVLHGEKRTSEVNRILEFLSNKNESKVLIQIDTFITGKNSIDITSECIKRIKSLKLPILLTSHLPIPDELKNMVDFYEEDLNNILLPSDGSLSDLTFNNHELSSLIILENSDSHAPACLTSIINGAKFAKRNNFEYFIRFEYDVILTPESIDFLKSLILNCSKKRGFIFGNGDWLDGKVMMLNSSEYLQAFYSEIKTSYDYLSILREYNTPTEIERHLQNVQYFILKSKGLLENVEVLPTSTVEGFIDSDFLDGRVSAGIFRPVYLDDSNFATICHGWNKGEISVSIYCNNSLIANFNQFFYKGHLTYNVFDFFSGNKYEIVTKNEHTFKEDKFNFSTLDELKRMGKLNINNKILNYGI